MDGTQLRFLNGEVILNHLGGGGDRGRFDTRGRVGHTKMEQRDT